MAAVAVRAVAARMVAVRRCHVVVSGRGAVVGGVTAVATAVAVGGR
ncbi:MAG: hypothetical protein ACI8W8_003587, partial [Rhodothermales bacterium]